MLDTKKTVTRMCKVCETKIIVKNNGQLPNLDPNTKKLEIAFSEQDQKEGGQEMFCYCGTLLWIPCNTEENVQVMLQAKQIAT